IIIGGSNSGVTLAHCLHYANIPHIDLEKTSDPAPQVGAPIGIMPDRARILDQLGRWKKIEYGLEPLARPILIYPGAFQVESSYPKVMRKRFKYPIAFIDRQRVLQVLYEGYPRPERIRFRKKERPIESSDDGATVTTADGKIHKRHIFVGTDGVHSGVKTEIWKVGDRLQPGRITAQERTALTTQYICISGILSPIERMPPEGQIHRGRLYWFLTQMLDKRYTWPDRPRFADDGMAAAAAKLDGFRVYNYITFEGANMVIEDAATLRNLLTRLLRDGKTLPTSQQIDNLSNHDQSILVVRVCTLNGLRRTLMMRYVIPHAVCLPVHMIPNSWQMQNSANYP
ncbi:hypothetical protein ASPNIDRAFT_140908, partial [Aspergillus niger ATCC 1015]